MTTPTLSADLCVALHRVAVLGADLREPWWVIGSAALALHGIAVGAVADVDLLTGAGDARRLLALPGSRISRDAARDRFRSVYGRVASPGVRIEVMGALEVRSGGVWHAVRPATRIARPLAGGGVVHVPDRAELAAMLRQFGRPKDLARAELFC